MEHVEAAMRGGATLDQIGSLLGVTNFRSRYNAMRHNMKPGFRRFLS